MRRLLSLVIKILAGYALIGFAIIPAVIHLAAAQLAPRFLTVPAHIGAVHFNPFTLRLSVESIKLGENDAYLAGLSSFSVDLAWDSLMNQELHIQSLELGKPFAEVILDSHGEINLSSIVKTSNAVRNENKSETSSENTPALPVRLDRLNIQQTHVSFTDQLIALKSKTPFDVEISSLNIEGNDLGWPAMNGVISVSGHINQDGQFSVENRLTLPAMETTAKASLQNIDLAIIQPYLTPSTFAELKSGLLDAELDVSWSEQAGVSLSSDLTLSEVLVKDERNQSEILSWDKLELSSIEFIQVKNQLRIADITLAKPALTVEIEDNLKVNLAELVKEQEETTETTQEKNSAPVIFDIGRILIKQGSMDFADHSFRPGFVAPINNLNGEITGIRSNNLQPATFAITGQIDRYSPVNINGQIDLADPLANSELKLVFDSVELTTLTPYSGRFAGYTIHKGRMDLELLYRLQDHELSAQNSMLLEHLTLGEKVDSNEAIDLPLKLAIALLKDRDGRIDIKLPVKGNLDNPEFELGPVIRTALINMLTNIVSAPFDFLASLVGGDASEMQAVAFSQGVDNLAPHQQKALDSLVKALQDRPEIQLEVMGTASINDDWPVVAKGLLDEAWIDELTAMNKKADTAELAESETVQILKSIARKQHIEIPESLKQVEAKEYLLKSWPYDEAALRSLAIRRAKGIKGYLTDHGLEADRVFILDVQTSNENQTGATGSTASRLELTSG